MENELKELVEQLGNAIDEAIAQSGKIGDIVQEMEEAGYDLTLVLEATMRFTPKGQAGEDEPLAPELEASMSRLVPTAKFDLTPQDEEFLQALQIAI